MAVTSPCQTAIARSPHLHWSLAVFAMVIFRLLTFQILTPKGNISVSLNLQLGTGITFFVPVLLDVSSWTPSSIIFSPWKKEGIIQRRVLTRPGEDRDAHYLQLPEDGSRSSRQKGSCYRGSSTLAPGRLTVLHGRHRPRESLKEGCFCHIPHSPRPSQSKIGKAT